MITVIDASVAIKWFVVEEHLREAALAILDKIKAQPSQFAVPELFFNEMLAVFCRVLKSERLIQEHIESLQNLGFARLGNGKQTLFEAARLAKKFNLSGYDAIYAANAHLVGGWWLTADAKAHRKIATLGISKYLAVC